MLRQNYWGSKTFNMMFQTRRGPSFLLKLTEKHPCDAVLNIANNVTEIFGSKQGSFSSKKLLLWFISTLQDPAGWIGTPCIDRSASVGEPIPKGNPLQVRLTSTGVSSSPNPTSPLHCWLHNKLFISELRRDFVGRPYPSENK